MSQQRAISAQNLANLSVPGFRRDLAGTGETGFLIPGSDGPTRAFRIDKGRHAFSEAMGEVQQTGDPFDLMVEDGGFFVIQPATGGSPALSRRGDMSVDRDGILINGAGDRILNTNFSPITVPPFRSMIVDEIGQIMIEPINDPGEQIVIGTIGTLRPDPSLELGKGPDGQIRPVDGRALPLPDQLARVKQGALEGSNVNATAELLETIEMQRGFEVNLRMIQTARDVDEAGTSLLRIPQV